MCFSKRHSQVWITFIATVKHLLPAKCRSSHRCSSFVTPLLGALVTHVLTNVVQYTACTDNAISIAYFTLKWFENSKSGLQPSEGIFNDTSHWKMV